MNYKKIEKRFWEIKFNKKEDFYNHIICLSLDIKDSTKMIDKLNLERSLEIVKPFIRECNIILQQKKYFDNIIYAGDGFNAISYVNNDFDKCNKIFDIVTSLNTLVLIYENLINSWKQVKWNFEVGIGIWCDEVICTKIKDMQKKFNNNLYIGNSVSKATKLCNESKNFECSAFYNDIFYNNLNEENKKFLHEYDQKIMNQNIYFSPFNLRWKNYELQ